MKRLYKTMLLVIMSFMCLIYGRTAYAANDDFTRATDISVNQVVTDKMAYTNSTDYNYYKFTISADGYINISFSHAEMETTLNCWNITLYSLERNSIKTISSKGSQKNIVSNNIGLPKGTYYVCIDNDNLKRSTIDYQLQISYMQTNNWETEFNDGFLQADDILVNQLVNGSMMYTNSSERDYYKFTVPSNGYINMSFSHAEMETTLNCWNITLYDAERTSIVVISSKGSDKNVISNNIGLQGGTYYVCVDNDNLKRSTIDYQLQINYVQTAGWETEFNDGFMQADEIWINQPVSGNMLYSNTSDKDYYKFTVPQYGYIKIDFTHAWLETDLDCWRIELYDETRNNLGRIMSKGSKPNDTAYAWLGAGTYYICVDNQYLTNSTVDYTLNVTYSTPKARIKSLTSDSEKLILKWKKLQGISGYQIVTATNKKFTKNKKVTTIKSKKKSKTTIKKLKRKKTYYVKMRGYITVNGVKYYGPYSKVKKIKIR